MIHELCSLSIEQLGSKLYNILAKDKSGLKEKDLLSFTKVCLLYNAYLEKVKVTEAQIKKANKNKFQKYDFNKDKVFDES